MTADDSPRFAFDDSRRLTGANRWFPGSAVMLNPLGSLALDASAHERWAATVRSTCAALGWPDPHPVVHRHAAGAFLAFAAPAHALFTATEVNEWAWEQAVGERLAIEGFDPAHADRPDFAARAERELLRPLVRLRVAASVRGVPVFDDDDAVTLGAGAFSRTWPRAALPLPMDVPWSELRDIPKALVTGSNGKTTTVRLLAAIARSAGLVAGLSSTEGIALSGEVTAPLERGDWSGPAGARAVLRDRRVTLAVLETARGGIARRGLGVAQADAAIVTNISADHFGEHGVDSLDDLAELKLAVAHAVSQRGVLVLNADDAVTMRVVARLRHAASARHALFALEHDAAAHAAASACGLRDGHLWLTHEGHTHHLGSLAEIPLAANGAAPYNVMNAAAAALAAVAGLGLPIEAVRTTLQRFGLDPRDNPGRLERHAYRDATVLIDYAHNPDGLARLLAVAKALPHRRLLLLLGQAGNRDDRAIAELARAAAAAHPDLVVIKELPRMLRGRALGEVPALLHRALADAGMQSSQCSMGGDEADSALSLLHGARAGDMLVMPLHSDEGRVAVGRVLAGG